MRNAVMLAVLISAAIFMSGCANSFGTMVSGSRTNTDVVPKTNVGGKGVEIFWLDNAPPGKVQKGTRFKIGIELQNRGFHDVKNGILKVWACKNMELTGQGVTGGVYSSTFDLRKSDLNNPVGEMTRRYFSANAVEADESCYIHAQACYLYQTHVSQQVCLDPEPYSENDVKACRFSEEISVPEQGAPVVVDKIEDSIVSESEESGTSEFQFNIYVKNSGTGQVVADDAMKGICEGGNSEDLSKRYNVVKMNARLGTTLLRCEPDEIVLVKDEEKRIPFRCYYEMQKSRGAFPSVVTINLFYGYIQGSEVDVKIEGKKDSAFEESGTCPANNCKPRGVWGVCKEVYGGFQEDKSCADPAKVCCKESVPKCERDYGSQGYKCVANCAAPDPDKKNTCPGSERCCKVNS